MNDRYVAYLVRLWRVGEGERALYRASLEDPHTGDVRAFASLEGLVAYLKARIGSQNGPESMGSPAGGTRPNEGGCL